MSRARKVVITGGNSAVGRAILRRAADLAAPVTLVAAVRSERAARELEAASPGNGRVARISYDDPESLREAFRDATAVIHLAGILLERPGSSYEQANVETTRRVADAARASAVEKLVFVSAVGADEASSNRYWQTKGRAEALVRASGLVHTVLRVPLLLGRGTEGAAALRRSLNGQRAMLIGGGRHLQQPLHVDDLARAAVSAADPGVAKDRTLDLVGPVSLPDREIVARAASLLDRRIRIWSIPKRLVWLVVAIRQRFSGPGFSVDVLEVITSDTKVDPLPAASELGIRLSGIDDMIEQSLERAWERT
jgi:NADH dehydrogenase